MIGRLKILPCLVALAALSTACDGTSSGAESPDAGNTAAAATSATASSDPAAVAALAAVQGACQQTTWKAAMQLAVAASGQKGTLTADMLADPRPGHYTAHMTSNMGLELELVDGYGYLRQGATKWTKIAVASLSADQLRPPCNEFTVLSGPGITGVQELSDQTAGSTHHYRFHGDAYTLLAASMLYSPQPLAVFQDHRVQISADLYTDASGHPVRYETESADVNDGSNGLVSLKLTETYSDFGTAVTVVAPAASEITDQPSGQVTPAVPPNPTAP